MKKLILVRHGQSEWNLKNLFTGWTDVDLTEQGIQEAYEAGKTMLNEGIKPEICFTSYLKRAIKTLNVILDAMNMDYLPVEKSWRLNEKSYGDLQGKNKAEATEKFGAEQVLLWRRSFDVQAPALNPNDERSPYNDPRYSNVDRKELPLTESLQDCINRLMPFYTGKILKVFDLKDMCMSTSGNTPHYTGHIVDPRTGRPDSSTRTSVIIARDALDAEVLSTVWLIAGDTAGKDIASGFDIESAWLF